MSENVAFFFVKNLSLNFHAKIAILSMRHLADNFTHSVAKFFFHFLLEIEFFGTFC